MAVPAAMDVCKDGERDPWLREALRLLQLASGTDDMKLIVSAEIKVCRSATSALRTGGGS